MGNETRTARVEVRQVLANLLQLPGRLVKTNVPFARVEFPSGVYVSSTVLRETWAVAQLRDGVDFPKVAAVVGRHVAVRALEASTSYGDTRDLALRYDVSTVGRVALRPRLRLVAGGKS